MRMSGPDDVNKACGNVPVNSLLSYELANVEENKR